MSLNESGRGCVVVGAFVVGAAVVGAVVVVVGASVVATVSGEESEEPTMMNADIVRHHRRNRHPASTNGHVVFLGGTGAGGDQGDG
jgi:hypothetical protein